MICQRQIIIILPAYLFRIGISNKILQKLVSSWEHRQLMLQKWHLTFVQIDFWMVSEYNMGIKILERWWNF